jgi:hypothetical protein
MTTLTAGTPIAASSSLIAEIERELPQLPVAVAPEEGPRLVHEAVDRLLAAQAGLPDRAAGKDAAHRAVPGSLLQPQHLRDARIDPQNRGRFTILFAQVVRPPLARATTHLTALNSLARRRAIRVRP